MAKALICFSPPNSIPIPNRTQPKFAKSKIYASGSVHYPLASKIFVKNLSFSISESCLREKFSKFGQIAEVKLIKDEATKKSKGYAFIQYTSQEEAVLALESMDHQYFDGRLIFVDIAKPRQSDFGGYPKTLGPPPEPSLATEGGIDD